MGRRESNIQDIAKSTIAGKKKTQNQWITNKNMLEIEKRRIVTARGLNTDERRMMYIENT